MLCPQCGGYAGENDILCPRCGALLDHSAGEDAGVRAIRQGKRAQAGGGQTASGASVERRPRAARRASGAEANTARMSATSRMGSIAPARTDWDDGQDALRNATGSLPLMRVADPDRPMRDVYGDTTRGPMLSPREVRRYKHLATQRMINWMAVLAGVIVLCLALAVGAYFYLTGTGSGQRIMARMGKDATSTALWEVGAEAMDEGDIEAAIRYFETAREKDGEEQVNVNGLLELGAAYEAMGRTDDAETIYRAVYTSITPSAPEAYRSEIRIMQADGRLSEAASLMLTAYEMTGLNSFRVQRTELLPETPQVDVKEGYYTAKPTLTIVSPQSYDLYFTFEADAELPEGTLTYTGALYTEDGAMEMHAYVEKDGLVTDVKLATYQRYTEPVFLEEGTWELRAVAVNEELVSDPLKATYKVYMSAPLQPNASLAPNTYKQRQRIWLKPGTDKDGKVPVSKDEKENELTFYYTIDGSTPDIDSPVYTGEPFWLPGGRVTLKAVAVNGYNKASNILEILYKIEAKPYPLEAYTTKDTANGLTLLKTTREEFQEKYGSGERMEEIVLEGYTTACQRYHYGWGYATMGRVSNSWVLIGLHFTSSQLSGPRSTHIGDTENDVVGKFRDMGQVESPSGNRGLYENDDGKGKIYRQEDGSKIIRYLAETGDGHQWQLDYVLSTGGTVTAIDMTYVP